MEAIQELAEQLGVTVDNLLEAYAPYVLGTSIGNMILFILIFIASLIVFIIFLTKYYKSKNDKLYGDATMGVVAIVSAAILIFTMMCAAFIVPDAIGTMLSPSGAAIKNMIHMVTG